jgi:hypothetical protein
VQQGAERSWTAGEAASALRLRESAAAHHLEQLARCDLLDVRIGTEMRYRYAPATDELATTVARLYDAYRDRRAEIVAILSTRRSRSLRAFADAFRLGGDPDDG